MGKPGQTRLACARKSGCSPWPRTPWPRRCYWHGRGGYDQRRSSALNRSRSCSRRRRPHPRTRSIQLRALYRTRRPNRSQRDSRLQLLRCRRLRRLASPSQKRPLQMRRSRSPPHQAQPSQQLRPRCRRWSHLRRLTRPRLKTWSPWHHRHPTPRLYQPLRLRLRSHLGTQQRGTLHRSALSVSLRLLSRKLLLQAKRVLPHYPPACL